MKLIAFCILGLFVYGIYKMISDGNKFKDFLKEQKITKCHYYHTNWGDGKYIIDDQNRDMLWIYKNKGYIGRGYSRITDVELVIDDSVAYKTSLASSAGRAVVGGVLVGGVGAIIGGVTGKKNGKKVVHKIELILSFDTPNNPYAKVTFLDSKQGEDIFSSKYKEIYDKALYWSKLIESLMTRN